MPEFELYFVYIDIGEGLSMKSAKGSLLFVKGMLTQWIEMCRRSGFRIISAQILPHREGE